METMESTANIETTSQEQEDAIVWELAEAGFDVDTYEGVIYTNAPQATLDAIAAAY